MPAAYSLPQLGEPLGLRFRLGSLCLNGHDWAATGQSLRYAKVRGACVFCARASAQIRQEKRKNKDPLEFKAKAAAYVREKRQREGRPSRAKHSPDWHEQRRQQRQLESALRKALKAATKSPTVALLVYQEQVNYWREHPDARIAHYRRYSRWLWKWRYMVDPEYNIHERQRNSERKARNRGNHTVNLKHGEIVKRFTAFDNSCCYCGSRQNIQVEHFIPRSKGGPHSIGNLLPACADCNKNKRASNPEDWYKSQPFFTEYRWRKIRRELGLARAPVGQLALL